MSEKENKTKEETQELKDVQEKLCDTLKLSDDALNNNNGSLETRMGTIDKAIQKENEYALAIQKRVMAEAESNAKDSMKNMNFSNVGTYDEEKKSIEQFQEEIKKIYGDKVDLNKKFGGISDLKINLDKTSADEAIKILEDITVRMENAKGISKDYYDNFISGSKDAIDSLKQLKEEQDKEYQLMASRDFNQIADKLDISDKANLTVVEAGKIKRALSEIGDSSDENFKKYFDDYVDGLVKVEDETNKAKDKTGEDLTPPTNTETMENLKNVTSALGDLNEMYTKVLDKKSGKMELPFKADEVEKLRETFGGLGETFDNFEKTLLDGGSTAEQVMGAFNSLTSEYLVQSGVLDGLNTSNRDMIVSQLELQGVQNASEVITNDLAVASEALAQEGMTLSSVTMEEALKFIDEANCSDQAKIALINFKLAKIDVNNIVLATDGDIQNLIQLMEYCGHAVGALKLLAQAKASLAHINSSRSNSANNASDLREEQNYARTHAKIEKDAQAQVDDFVNSQKNNFNFNTGSVPTFNYRPQNVKSNSGGGGGSKGSKGKKGKSGGKDKASKYVDQGLDDILKVLDEKGKAIENKIKEVDARIALAEAQGNETVKQELEKKKQELLNEKLSFYADGEKQLDARKAKYVKYLQGKNFKELKGFTLNDIDSSDVEKINRTFEKEENSAKDDKTKNAIKYRKDAINEYVKAIAEINDKAKEFSTQAIQQETEIINNSVSVIADKYKPMLDNIEMRQERLNSEPVSNDLGAERYLKNQEKQLDLLTEKYDVVKKKLQETMNIKSMTNKSEAVRELQKELMSIGKEKYDLILSNIDLDFDVENIPIDKLEDVRSMISDAMSFADYTDDLDEEIELNVQGTEIIEEELDLTEKIIAGLKQKQSAYEKGSVEYEKYEKKINEALKNEQSQIKDLISYYEQLASKRAERDVYGSIGKDEWEYQNNTKLDDINDQKDAIEEQNKKVEKQKDLEEKLLHIKELEEKLANLKSQRTIQELKKDESTGQWQWNYTTDAKAIKETEKELAKARNEAQEEQEENASDLQKQAIQEQIDALEKEAKDKQKEYEDQEHQYTQFYRNQLNNTRRGLYDINNETDRGINNVDRTTKSGLEKLGKTYKDKMNKILSSVKDVCAKIQAELSAVDIDGKPMNTSPTRDRLASAISNSSLLPFLGLGTSMAGLALKTVARFDTGGSVGNLPSSGGLAIVDDKEIVLNKQDSQNILGLRDVLRENKISSRSNLSTSTDNSKNFTIQHMEVNYSGDNLYDFLRSCETSLASQY